MTLVRDYMTTAVETVHSRLNAVDLERRLCALKVSGVPVVDDGELVGVVSRGDLVRQLAVAQSWAEFAMDYFREPGLVSPEREGGEADELAALVGQQLQSTRVADVMTRDLITIPADVPLKNAAKRLIDHRVHRLLVTEDRGLAGVLSSQDLVRAIAEGRLAEVD